VYLFFKERRKGLHRLLYYEYMASHIYSTGEGATYIVWQEGSACRNVTYENGVSGVFSCLLFGLSSRLEITAYGKVS